MACSPRFVTVVLALGVFILFATCSLPALAAGADISNLSLSGSTTDSGSPNYSLSTVNTSDNNLTSLFPVVEWERIYTTPKSDVGYNAVETDGGYLVLGVTQAYGNGSYDAWLLKIDRQGNEIWNRTYGGTGGDWLYGIAPTSDGNYVMAGAIGSGASGGFDIWLVKVNANGDLIWSKTFGSTQYDAGFSVAEGKDGGYAVTGYWTGSGGESDFVIIHTDKDGNLIWQKMYQNGVKDWGKSITATSDGGYAIGGWTQATSGSKAQAYLLKIDGNGDKQWSHAYGLPIGDSYGYGIIQTDDGSYILSGYTNAVGAGGTEYYVVKVDAAGNTVWEKAYGQPGDDYCFGVMPVSDGYLLGGYKKSSDSDLSKIHLIKTDKDGTVITFRDYGPDDVGVTGGLSLKTSDGGYLVVGNTNEYGSGKDDLYVMKLGTAPAAAPAEDLAAKAAMPVAAVVAGTGLSFLALYMGRIFDYLTMLFNRIIAGINQLWASLMKFPLISSLYKLVYGYVNGRIKSRILGLLEKPLKKGSAVERVPFLAGFSARELEVLAISAVLLGLAFLVAKKMNVISLDNLVLYVFMAGFVTSLHDLAHRYYAFKYKSVAEYKFWGFGTVVMFLTALGLGVTYAVPAQTIIDKTNKMSLKEQAMVYLSGPMVSLILTLGFLLLVPLGGVFKTIGLLGVGMNMMSAVYGMTPFVPNDGNKVYKWNKGVWASIFIPLLLLYLGITIFLA